MSKQQDTLLLFNGRQGLQDKERVALELISDDWRLAKQLLGVLSRVDLVTRCLGGERYSTLSWCLPLMSSLAAYCKEDVEDERLIVTSLKAHLHKSLEKHFMLSNTAATNYSAPAAAMDPRFRDLTFF